ncbi:MAG: hypothetical protein QOC97_170 [Chloroflexota bacterium]|nr:hypothetical protein [Chloroflexota bacterium]
MPRPAAGLIAAAIADAADEPPAGAGRVMAVGWATIDLDRAVSELTRDLGLPAESFAEAVDSEALGARGRVAPAAIDSRTGVVILEPSTEGRLAAFLARHGEGPAAIWFLAGGDGIDGVGVDRAGPFGPERLVPGGPVGDVLRFLVLARPGTIRA